jgi:alkylhydroperoxidase/carboxymuconolactone decarboxylase family protein YurZ
MGGFDVAALGGPPQTAASVGAAVQAGSLDQRTRSLLRFGMALVRLAPGEARAALQAGRQAGLTDADWEVVIQLAQALGGGPSERLGRKVLSG